MTKNADPVALAALPTEPESRHKTFGGWSLSAATLVILASVFPLIFTGLELGSLTAAPVLLSFVITQWASLRLAGLLARGEMKIVQATFWVFVYVWFGLAALAETVAQRFPIVDQTFTQADQTEALIAVIVGLAAYEVGLVVRRSSAKPTVVQWLDQRTLSLRRILMIGYLGVIAAVVAIPLYGLGVFFRSRRTAATAVYGQPAPGVRLFEIDNKAVGLLQATLIWAPAFVALYLLLVYRNAPESAVPERAGRSRLPARAQLLLIALIVANLIVNNPISSPRYRFGGVALALAIVAWPVNRPHRFRVWLCALIVGVLVAFPLLDIFRNDDRKIQLTPLKEQLLTSPDFGMFQQEVNAQVYVDENGFTFGQQVLGVVGGYVPRVLWPGKPTDTGNLIVRTSAINASASLWATVFVDGGLFAVALTFLAYGWTTRVWEDLYIGNQRGLPFIAAAVPLYAGFQIILLRGDLQPAVGQVAPLLVMLLFAARRSGNQIELD